MGVLHLEMGSTLATRIKNLAATARYTMALGSCCFARRLLATASSARVISCKQFAKQGLKRSERSWGCRKMQSLKTTLNYKRLSMSKKENPTTFKTCLVRTTTAYIFKLKEAQNRMETLSIQTGTLFHWAKMLGMTRLLCTIKTESKH